MTRNEFKLRLLGEVPRYVPKAYYKHLESVTDPSFAMSGAQILANSLRGIPVASPIGLEFNGKTIEQVTPLDKPIKERLDVIQIARDTLKETDDITRKAYDKMIKQIEQEQLKDKDNEK